MWIFSPFLTHESSSLQVKPPKNLELCRNCRMRMRKTFRKAADMVLLPAKKYDEGEPDHSKLFIYNLRSSNTGNSRSLI